MCNEKLSSWSRMTESLKQMGGKAMATEDRSAPAKRLPPPSQINWVLEALSGPSWVLLPVIFETSATLPWGFRVVALSAQQSRVFFSSHLPTLQLCRIAPSQLLVPHFGMGYLWRSDCSLGLSLTPFTLI